MKLEENTKNRSKKQNIQKVILHSLYGVGLLSMALLAPNAVGSIIKLSGNNFKNKNYRIKRSISNLIEKNLVTIDKGPRGTFIKITEEGKRVVDMLYAGEIKTKKQKWDGKWRIVIYDLKETKRPLRDKLRYTLINFGFIKLQNSVWVYPYDCEELIVLIKADFKIGKEILYLIADALENDKWLRNLFELPSTL